MKIRGVLVAALACSALGPALSVAAGDADVGRRLFEGAQALPAQITGQGVALPVGASRCANCHGLQTAAPAVSATPIGPVLGPANLVARQPRRGGPPSAYGEASFCRLLRTGIDPASVIVDRRMPRYDVSDADCAALWRYVAQRP